MKIPKHKFFLAATDYVLIVASFILALRLRFPFISLRHLDLLQQAASGDIILVACYAFIWIAIFQHFNLYKINVFLTIVDQFLSLFKEIEYGLIGLIVVSFFTKRAELADSRLVVGIFFMLISIIIGTFRIVVFRQLFFYLSHKQILGSRLLIVGAGRSGQKMAANLSVDLSYGLKLIG